MNYSDLVNTAVEAGYLLVANGGEIYRAEESMQRIFRAYGVETGEVFVIPTLIEVTVCTRDGRPITRIKRVPTRTMNLDRVDQVNALCRRIWSDKPQFSEIRAELDRIGKRPTLSFPMQILAYALIGAAFTLFYGGSPRDAAVALFCGAAIRLVTRSLELFRVNSFFINVAASFVAAAIALTAANFDFFLSYDKIIIGSLMNLVPGIAITNFMRDIIAGDLIAGILRLTESVLVATAIAIGAGIALTASRMLLGV
ncbi:hypothetical protein A7X67_00255 [Clostridium sp. W14A]|uniref:Threonine/serine exporter family protein n=1 Tax=Caproicibacter fermentans TaxID=2576756 RepID=A0A7G8T940_9FIRM|nr:threonine/serine exporter family protein [Caproicibacter fermentans]OCN01003.1 hypothetical protein A7X67_00255 [Clostridium sp. W14A]QNK40131.1 threonine/serine exporter family protein [Caproicibacter fermentans]